VLIVSDDEVLRQRIREALENTESVTLAGQAQNGQETMALVHKSRPDVVLVDIGASPTENLRIVAQVSKSSPDVRIIVLNESEQEHQVLDALRKGALGHLNRERAQSTEIVHAIHAAGRGEAVLSPDVAGHILDKVRERSKR
jgi:DNA-binding NarL/FixJ family response regulator